MNEYGLDKFQEKILLCDGNTLVESSVGVGKTHTLSAKVEQLIKTGINPANILVLTFTNKAADEMIQRIQDRVGYSIKINGGTFHKIALHVLRVYGSQAGLRREFVVLDPGDSKSIYKQFVERGDPETATTVQDVVSYARNSVTTIEKALDTLGGNIYNANFIMQIFDKYHQYKTTHGYVDFDDLLIYFEYLLDKNKGIRDFLASTYRYVLVDEYQDVNTLQYNILKHLSTPQNSIYAVGDVMQTLYTWRAADPSIIMGFADAFDANVIQLKCNYRSTRKLITFYNQIIDEINIPEEYKVRLEHPENTEEGAEPILLTCQGPNEQARIATNLVQKYLDLGIPIHKIAVLYRSSNTCCKMFEAFLVEKRVNYVTYGGRKYLELAHIKDITALIKVSVNKGDRIAILRCLQLLKGVGRVGATRYTERFLAEGPDSLISVGTPTSYLAKLHEFLTKEHKSYKAYLDYLFDYYEELLEINYANDNYKKRLSDITMLKEIAGTVTSPDQLVDMLALEDPIKDNRKEEEKLVLSTIHSAKGLEFDAVILLNCSDGMLPSVFGGKTDIEEEHRAFFVAVTRAKRHLTMISPQGFKMIGSYHYVCAKCRFLNNLTAYKNLRVSK